MAAALIAVAVLMPESRSAPRPGNRRRGRPLSSAGLAGLTYGFIRAAQDGRNAGAIAAIAAGAVALTAFAAWDRLLTRRAARLPRARARPGGCGR